MEPEKTPLERTGFDPDHVRKSEERKSEVESVYLLASADELAGALSRDRATVWRLKDRAQFVRSLDHLYIERTFPVGSSEVYKAALTSPYLPANNITQATLKANEVFEDKDYAERWLNRPSPATDSLAPINLLSTSEGLAKVEALLDRIAYGVMA